MLCSLQCCGCCCNKNNNTQVTALLNMLQRLNQRPQFNCKTCFPCNNNSRTLPACSSESVDTPHALLHHRLLLPCGKVKRTVCALLPLPLAGESGQLFYRGKRCTLLLQKCVVSLLFVHFAATQSGFAASEGKSLLLQPPGRHK